MHRAEVVPVATARMFHPGSYCTEFNEMTYLEFTPTLFFRPNLGLIRKDSVKPSLHEYRLKLC